MIYFRFGVGEKLTIFFKNNNIQTEKRYDANARNNSKGSRDFLSNEKKKKTKINTSKKPINNEIYLCII